MGRDERHKFMQIMIQYAICKLILVGSLIFATVASSPLLHIVCQ